MDDSSDSDFYGDDQIRTRLEKRCKRRLEIPHDFPLAAKKLKSDPESNITAKSPSKRTAPPEKAGNTNVLDFLKSRPQISSMRKDHANSKQPVVHEGVRTLSGQKTGDLIDNHDRFKGEPSAWQRDESISEFMSRAPVTEPATSDLGPWLWVDNRKISHHHRQLQQKADLQTFTDGGVELLTSFRTQQAKIETENPGKPPGIITRYLNPYRQQLEDDLLSLAVKTHIISGKWMLFLKPADLARTWKIVAEATAEGKLGPTSKVATYDAREPSRDRLMCIYTYDFSDEKDVRRVLDELIELGLCSKESKGIYYKCDAYTHLDIGSGNEYKIRASLYSSQDLLSQKVKAIKDGPIARLQKRSGTVDSLMS